MKRKKFKINIDASREKVWDVLWGTKTYPKWTAPFSEGSHAETNWEEGSKVLFLNAEGEGMVSRIASKKPNEFMSIEHLGYVKDGVEDTESEQIKEWAGAFENYHLNASNGKTALEVEMDITDDHLDYFIKTWPLALEKVKEIAEANRSK